MRVGFESCLLSFIPRLFHLQYGNEARACLSRSNSVEMPLTYNTWVASLEENS